MTEPLISLELEGVAHSPQVDAAVRRRARNLGRMFPAVCEWTVKAASGHEDGPYEGCAAKVGVLIVGGERFEADVRAASPLEALRLAFNDVESQLLAESANARKRAFAWMQKVRHRSGLRDSA